ncbi:MAG: AAA family ATPase [Lachnospiraceae bacterium]|nr:AAA family ATPase [Lachnospiraceae bacterium]
MSIKYIEISNVMAFQSYSRKKSHENVKNILKEDAEYNNVFTLDFCDGINVLLGENGVGKTTILKMIYTATQCSFKSVDERKTKKLLHFFSANLKDNGELKNYNNKDGFSYYKISDGQHVFLDSLSHDGLIGYDKWIGLNIQSVYIPTMEMLSHSKGFLALNQKYNMPFDGTQIDIVVNASLPEIKDMPKALNGILKKISDTIDGEVVMEDDTFYIVKKDGRKVDFSLEAEGLRKLGLLWKLIRNGLLEEGSILLWDEPEANLNPELFPLVAEILLELQKNGVQIFVATHSYNFAKYLEIKREDDSQVYFHNLYRVESNFSEILKKEIDMERKDILSSSAYHMDDLKSNHIILADNKLLDEIYDM